MTAPVAAIAGTGFIGPVHIEGLRRIGIPVRGFLGSTPETERVKIETEDYGAVLLRFKGGARCDGGFPSHGPTKELRALRGRRRQARPRLEERAARRNVDWRARQSDRPLYATFGDGYRELLLCAANAESHRTQSWVTVPKSMP